MEKLIIKSTGSLNSFSVSKEATLELENRTFFLDGSIERYINSHSEDFKITRTYEIPETAFKFTKTQEDLFLLFEKNGIPYFSEVVEVPTCLKELVLMDEYKDYLKQNNIDLSKLDEDTKTKYCLLYYFAWKDAINYNNFLNSMSKDELEAYKEFCKEDDLEEDD